MKEKETIIYWNHSLNDVDSSENCTWDTMATQKLVNTSQTLISTGDWHINGFLFNVGGIPRDFDWYL